MKRGQNSELRLLRRLGLAVVMTAFLSPIVSAQVSSRPLFAWQESLHGDDDHNLRWPIAVATSASDEIAVADAYGSRIFLFKDNGGTIGWRLESVADLPATPAGLALDGDRYLISGRGERDLLVANRPSLQISKMRMPPGTHPGALAVARDGHILVFDTASQSVLVVNRSGGLQKAIEVGVFVTSIIVPSGGDFVVSSVGPGQIHRFTLAGEHLGTWSIPSLDVVPSWPSAVAYRSGGEVLVADRHTGRIVVLESGGQLSGTGSRWGWEAGFLRRPSDLSMLADGKLVVADQGNGRIQIFRPAD